MAHLIIAMHQYHFFKTDTIPHFSWTNQYEYIRNVLAPIPVSVQVHPYLNPKKYATEEDN